MSAKNNNYENRLLLAEVMSETQCTFCCYHNATTTMPITERFNKPLKQPLVAGDTSL